MELKKSVRFYKFAGKETIERIENGTVHYELQKVAAEVINMHEDAVVNAVIKFAIEEGITDLYLLDKEFVKEALAAAIKNRGGGYGT